MKTGHGCQVSLIQEARKIKGNSWVRKKLHRSFFFTAGLGFLVGINI
jgi:hypothetical protein